MRLSFSYMKLSFPEVEDILVVEVYQRSEGLALSYFFLDFHLNLFSFSIHFCISASISLAVPGSCGDQFADVYPMEGKKKIKLALVNRRPLKKKLCALNGI